MVWSYLEPGEKKILSSLLVPFSLFLGVQGSLYKATNPQKGALIIIFMILLLKDGYWATKDP